MACCAGSCFPAAADGDPADQIHRVSNENRQLPRSFVVMRLEPGRGDLRSVISTMRHGSAAERARLGFEVLLAVVFFAAITYYAHGIVKWPTDVDVYRLGADTFLHGHSIY